MKEIKTILKYIGIAMWIMALILINWSTLGHINDLIELNATKHIWPAIMIDIAVVTYLVRRYKGKVN